MSSLLEGNVLSGARYSPAERVAGEGGRVYLRREVLGLELRSERQAAATVLVFRDPATGRSSTERWHKPSGGGQRTRGWGPQRRNSAISLPRALRQNAGPSSQRYES